MIRIGPYTIHSIETGCFRLDGGAMFGIVPRVLWERRFHPDERNRITLAARCLLLEGNGRLILVDNGIGDKYDARFGDIYAIDRTHSDLVPALHAAGFSTGEVTDVVLTHLHFDHCGGSSRRAGQRLEVAFPHARFHVQRAHWEWAHHPDVRERASFLHENLDPLRASGQVHLLDGPGPLFEGVSVRVVNGHTEAQQLVKVSGPEGTLVFLADLIPTAAHLPLAWGMSYDVRPLVTVQEKAALLEAAIAGEWLLCFEHDPHVAMGRAVRNGEHTVLVDARPHL